MKKKKTKIMLIIVALLSVTILLRFYILANQSKNGKALGLIAGRLSPCPDKPNCANSEFVEDKSHYISHLNYPAAKSEEIMDLVKAVIQEAGGEIQSEQDSYMAFTFTVSIFGFADDLEIRLDKSKNIIHVRSGSRVGYSDLGVNRKRVECISNNFNKRIDRISLSNSIKLVEVPDGINHATIINDIKPPT